ncbi:MAG: hypothetical protein IPN49_16075 [Saprospiraceae bacterium]|nr:hypothetical protein [Saprospiraceae bacterium]MBK8820518.1 hypothetical protein [Saprospiraceae bacterium]MBK9043240.1 hypothetical protein [Saprospiraceae bacterium]
MNKIGFQANLFIIVLILLISITIFISCEKDNYTGLSKENLYGKWIGPTTMKVFDFETQMAKPINNIFEFKSNGLCSIKTPEFNFNFGIDCHPDIGSKWDIISNENTIIFYYIPDPGINLPKWECRWEVKSFHPDSMKVKVYDKAGKFVRERIFNKLD